MRPFASWSFAATGIRSVTVSVQNASNYVLLYSLSQRIVIGAPCRRSWIRWCGCPSLCLVCTMLRTKRFSHRWSGCSSSHRGGWHQCLCEPAVWRKDGVVQASCGGGEQMRVGIRIFLSRQRSSDPLYRPTFLLSVCNYPTRTTWHDGGVNEALWH